MAQDTRCLSPTVAGVRLELLQGSAQALSYDVPESGFLVGSVPGCDLRLPGVGLPPVICLIVPRSDGAGVRKLGHAQLILVNDRPFAGALLHDGDRIKVGNVTIVAHVSLPATVTSSPEATSEELERRASDLDEQARHLNEAKQKLQEQTEELEADRVIWYERRGELEREARQLQEQQRDVAAILADVARQKQANEDQLEQARRDLAALREQFDRERAAHTEEVERTRIAAVSAVPAPALPPPPEPVKAREVGESLQQQYERYRQRSDRVAALERAVRQAAHNLQQRKQQLEEEARTLAARQQALVAREAELSRQAEQISRDLKSLEAERHETDEARRKDERDRTRLEAELREHAARLDADRHDLDQKRQEHETHHQAEVVRLERLQAELADRQSQVDARATEIDGRYEQLQRDSRDLEEQAQQLDEWHRKLAADAERVAKQAAEFDGRSAELARRSATVESQQAALTNLRAKLERLHEDDRRASQELTEQRLRQEEAEADLERQRQEIQRLHTGVEDHIRELDLDRQALEDRRKGVERSAAELRLRQERISADEERLKARETELEAREAAQAREADLCRTQSAQLAQLQEKLHADRQIIRDRELELARVEQAREVLQEQLRRRSEELAERQKTLSEQGRLHAEAVTALETRRAEVDQQTRAVETRSAEMDRLRQELSQREETLHRQIERLKETGRKAAEGRKEWQEARNAWLLEQQQMQSQLEEVRAAANAAGDEALALAGRLPELEQRAQAAIDRLAAARDQLREHLGELHGYARQGQEDLNRLRGQVQAEAERVREEGLTLNRAREEHRLAITAFRQQVIDWQAQVTEIRRALAQDQTRLERRQAQLEADSARLAHQAEDLQVQERVVAEQRGEMNRHLADMREWYRRKLRELTERSQGAHADADADASGVDGSAPNILSLNDDIDPGDRQLGDLLQSLQLVEADTLASLLSEARKQRRSLRQMLLASGCVTLYQMALIETGNLGALMLGPVRVIDRLRATAHEVVYRVFDPRRATVEGSYAVLRHLAESEMRDAVRPDEFRQRFGTTVAIRQENVAGTFEVLEIGGRPAVLQEAITGLPATEWPAFVAVPGVLFRLLRQAAQGLEASHRANVIHGHLDADHVLLTSQGVLKLLGFGEPGWLLDHPPIPDDPSIDLMAVGELFAACLETAAPRRKNAKTRPLPEGLQAVLHRLQPQAGDDRYASAADLLAELDALASDIPDAGDTWERLMQYVAAQLGGQNGLRQTA